MPALRERYSARITDFDEKRILEATAFSAEPLPKVFSELLGKAKAKAATKPAVRNNKGAQQKA
jgi:hypothetical protein